MMTEDETQELEKWKQRAKRFQRAYHEQERKALDLKLAFDFKTLITDRRIAELESQLGAKLGTYPN